MAKQIIKCTCELASILRAFAPLSGDEYRQLVIVDLKPGESLNDHAHKHHTVVCYPEDSNRPITIYPRAGMLVYLPPGTKHDVPPGDDSRVSIAMVIDETD